MKDIFARCFKKMAVQVCTSHIHVFLPVQLPCVLLVCPIIILDPGFDSHYWLLFIFFRLKIIHDSHELILESGSVANNSYIQSLRGHEDDDIPVQLRLRIFKHFNIITVNDFQVAGGGAYWDFQNHIWTPSPTNPLVFILHILHTCLYIPQALAHDRYFQCGTQVLPKAHQVQLIISWKNVTNIF